MYWSMDMSYMRRRHGKRHVMMNSHGCVLPIQNQLFRFGVRTS